MDNLESIFQSLREQIEHEIFNPIIEDRMPSLRNTTISDQEVAQLMTNYINLLRENQEMMSIFNVNMLSLIEIIRRNNEARLQRDIHERVPITPIQQHTRQTYRPTPPPRRSSSQERQAQTQEDEEVEQQERTREETVITPQSIHSRINTPIYPPLNTPLNPPLHRIRHPDIQTGATRRRPGLFSMPDVSRNIRTHLPNFFSPRIQTPRDPSFFFGGLGPELRDVVVRPSQQQIMCSTRRFVFISSMQLRDNTCPITRTEFEEGDLLCEIKHCQHYFKNEAIQTWFRNNVRCPVCRYDIRDYVPEVNEEENTDTNENVDLNESSELSENSFINHSNEQGLLTESESSDSLLNEALANNTSARYRTFIEEDEYMTDLSTGISDMIDQVVYDLSNVTGRSNDSIYSSLTIPFIYNQVYDISRNVI